MNWPIVLGALLLASCASSQPGGALTGSWGGRHVGLVLTGSGGVLEYDCAAGTMTSPLTVRSDGRFSAVGTHLPGTGGPERVGEVRPAYPARYSGSVRGNTMSLLVEVPSTGIVIGPYDLRLGADPQLMRCL